MIHPIRSFIRQRIQDQRMEYPLQKQDLSGCLPCSRKEGQETADQINVIATFARNFLKVKIKVVSQAGRSTIVSKHCVSKLRGVDVTLRNGYHISIPGYLNKQAFKTKEPQVHKSTSNIRQISNGLGEVIFLTNAVQNPSLLIADPEHGMTFEVLEELWNAQSYLRGLRAKAGGGKAILAATGLTDINAVPIETVRSMAHRYGMIDRAGGVDEILASTGATDINAV